MKGKQSDDILDRFFGRHVSARIESVARRWTIHVKRALQTGSEFHHRTDTQTNWTFAWIWMLLTAPMMQSLHVTTVQIHVRLFLLIFWAGSWGTGTSWYDQRVQTDRTKWSSCVHRVDHLLKHSSSRRVSQTFGRSPHQSGATQVDQRSVLQHVAFISNAIAFFGGRTSFTNGVHSAANADFAPLTASARRRRFGAQHGSTGWTDRTGRRIGRRWRRRGRRLAERNARMHDQNSVRGEPVDFAVLLPLDRFLAQKNIVRRIESSRINASRVRWLTFDQNATGKTWNGALLSRRRRNQRTVG